MGLRHFALIFFILFTLLFSSVIFSCSASLTVFDYVVFPKFSGQGSVVGYNLKVLFTPLLTRTLFDPSHHHVKSRTVS